MKIRIEDYSDGFAIVITDDEKHQHRFLFDQEDDKSEMLAVFETLGFEDVDYEEVC